MMPLLQMGILTAVVIELFPTEAAAGTAAVAAKDSKKEVGVEVETVT